MCYYFAMNERETFKLGIHYEKLKDQRNRRKTFARINVLNMALVLGATGYAIVDKLPILEGPILPAAGVVFVANMLDGAVNLIKIRSKNKEMNKTKNQAKNLGVS